MMHLFKIACLSYFPGKVEYGGHSYSKANLLKVQEQMVENLRAILRGIGSSATKDKKNLGNASELVIPMAKKMRRDDDVSSEEAKEDIET